LVFYVHGCSTFAESYFQNTADGGSANFSFQIVVLVSPAPRADLRVLCEAAEPRMVNMVVLFVSQN
jgi:hypothetical protein